MWELKAVMMETAMILTVVPPLVQVKTVGTESTQLVTQIRLVLQYEEIATEFQQKVEMMGTIQMVKVACLIALLL